jgi:hypothetical protein
VRKRFKKGKERSVVNEIRKNSDNHSKLDDYRIIVDKIKDISLVVSQKTHHSR